jgi:hypothetical protein
MSLSKYLQLSLRIRHNSTARLAVTHVHKAYNSRVVSELVSPENTVVQGSCRHFVHQAYAVNLSNLSGGQNGLPLELIEIPRDADYNLSGCASCVDALLV